MQIVDFFYNLARTSKRIKGFTYGRAYEKGAGTDRYPLVWLDDPIGASTKNDGAVFEYSVNVDFLGIPDANNDALAVQSMALDVALNFFEQIKRLRRTSGFSCSSFSFVTLRDYYDDNAAGVRLTYTINAPNPVNICYDDFDADKTLDTSNAFPSFVTDAPEGCAVFSNSSSLPSFSIDI